MNETTTTPKQIQNETKAGKKPGILGRLMQKLDDSLKQKAAKKSQTSCCGGDGKGGKCC